MNESHQLLLRLLAALIFALATATTSTTDAANILFLSGSLSPANHIWNRVIATKLADRGHNVTFLTAEWDVPPANQRLHFIHMNGVHEKVAQKFNSARENHSNNRQSVFRRIKEYFRVRNGISAEMSRSAGVQQLLAYPSTFQFDVLIYDSDAAQSLLGFWLLFQRPPLIAVSPATLPMHLHSVAQMPFYPGATLHPFADYAQDLVLADRVYNILYYLYDTIYRRYPYMAAENTIAKRLFGEAQLATASIESIEKQTQLFLVNTHPVIDAPVLLPANVIPVGPVQLERSFALPNSVQMFLDASRNGVIVFSWGAGLFTPVLTRDQDEVFMEVFRKLYQYDFLWKYDKTEKLECPRNVLMLDWLEHQHLILQHPKVQLLITNGGPLSVQEAVYAAVPMIGVPVKFDQKQRLMRLQQEGVAQLFPLRRLRNDTLFSVITKALDSDGQGSARWVVNE